jgi:uncharacterized protein (TIGR03435 family)
MHKVRMGKMAATLVLGCFNVTPAQTVDPHLRFEVAAVRTVQGVRTGLRGGPGTSDPTRLDWIVSRDALIIRAYDVEPDQISPDWRGLMTPIYEVTATLPEGTTQEHFRQMLQSLLAERFHLAIHQETKSVPAYRLVVAKSGPKLKVSEYVPPPTPTPVAGRHYFGDVRVFSTGVGGQWTVTGRGATIADLIRSLSSGLHARISDETGLTGRYDFSLSYSERSDAPGSFVTDAVRDRLGLDLEAITISLPIVVIDQFDKVPSEN